MATQRGSSPTGISAILLLTSLPFAFFTLMIEMLFASRLTTTKRCSSLVSAIVVERVGAALAFAGANSVATGAVAATASIAPASRVRDTELANFSSGPPDALLLELH